MSLVHHGLFVIAWTPQPLGLTYNAVLPGFLSQDTLLFLSGVGAHHGISLVHGKSLL